MTLLEACSAKNQLIKRHGFSPIQHVLGQDIRLPASVLAAPDELSAHSAAEPDGTFQRHLAIRQAARMAWARLDNSSRVRRAMLSKARTPRGPSLPGSQVYFWRRAGLSKKKTFKGRVRQDPDRWIGPGVVLAVEGSRAVWISYRAKLMKVAPEHVRDATAEETFAQEFVLEELAEQMMNVQAPNAQTGFYDLTGQGGLPGVSEAPEVKAAAATFILKDPKGKLCGVLVLHVDDGLLRGKGSYYEEALKKLQKRAPLKIFKKQALRFTGRTVTQDPKTHEIELTQKGYFDDVLPIPIDKKRKGQLEGPLTAHATKQLRSLFGKLAWPARETMPQIAFDVSEAQQKMAEPVVARLLEINALLRKAKKIESSMCSIRIPKIDLETAVMVAFSDASFGNMPRHGSQAGFMILVAGATCVKQSAKAAVVSWASHRIKRVVKSTLAAEAAALSEAQDQLEYARAQFMQMLGKVDGRNWQEALKMPGYLVIDAKSLYDSLMKPGSAPKEKRVALDLAAIQEALARETDFARWTPTRHMLADVLTKAMVKVPPYLEYVLSRGRVSLVESPEAQNVLDGRQAADAGIEEQI